MAQPLRHWLYADREAQQCESNEKNIGTALEMYSTDNSGRYPRSLSKLVPSYLLAIPTCPTAGTDTYSRYYQSASNPDGYTFMCTAKHKIAAETWNFPEYCSSQGVDSGH
jgi:hypothetical protein